MGHLFKAFVMAGFLAAAVSPAFGGGTCSDCFTASAVVGGYTFDGEQHLETAPVVGLRGGYNFTRYFGMEALFDYIPTEETRGGKHVDGLRYGGDLILHLLPEGPVVPFLAAGYGAVSLLKDDDHTFTAGMFDYGVGVKWFLNDSLAIRGDLRHLVFRDSDTQYNYEYTVGLSWQFGGAGGQRVAEKGPEPGAAPGGPTPTKPSAPAPPAEKAPAPVPSAEPPKNCVTLPIEMDIDRALIRPEYRDRLAQVGQYMKNYPSTKGVVEGNTDIVGSDEYNMELSRRRAEVVVSYLEQKFGIERARFTEKWFGKTQPVADNDTDEGRQKNRRAETLIECPANGEKITLPELLCINLTLHFDTGSAAIRPVDRKEIERVAAFLRENPKTTALIEGHTDNVGGTSSNLKLSRQRAKAVVDLLVREYGIDRSRLSAKGFGSTRRVAYNSTSEGRQKNRRVEAVVDCVVKK